MSDTAADKVVSLTAARKDQKPKTHNGDLRNLPAALAPLQAKPRWVLWRWEWRNKKWTKPPLQPSGKYASTDDDSTWHAYEEVISALGGAFDGIGYVLDDSDGAFDVDDCRDPNTGAIHPWAAHLVAEAGTYAEITVSGSGLRIIGAAQGPAFGKGRNKLSVADGVSCEFYRKATRYITISGNRLESAPDLLANIDAVMDRANAGLVVPSTEEDAADGEDELARTMNDGGGDRYDGDRSRAFWFVANEMVRRGYSRPHVENILLDMRDNSIADHIADQGRDPRAYVERQVDKAIRDIEFATDKKGKPAASPASICIAMAKLGVSERHDQFAIRDIIDGLDGFGPFLDDAAANRLWITMDQRFKFRPSRDLFHVVLSNAARLNEFHPVRNYLGMLTWDSTKRVDRWLTTYGGAEDNE